MKVSNNDSKSPPTLRFPRLSSTTRVKPWHPSLAGEGEFPKDQAIDPIQLAQQALDRMEAGMLKLHKAVDDEEDPSNHRPRAA